LLRKVLLPCFVAQEGCGALAVERFTIEGDLEAESFLPWIVRHLERLGLRGLPLRRPDGQVEITLSGPDDLIDAMELGVSLGPIDVWVEAIARQRLENGDIP
jgi:acylphosphatase